MSVSSSTSPVVSYATPRREPRPWWHFAVAAAVAGLLVLGLFRWLAGMRLVGFSYSVPVNNLATECPNTVVRVDGPRVTLDDGRVLEVRGPQAQWLNAELTDCQNRVRFDSGNNTLYTLRYIAHCGFDRPERSQLITIPLNPVSLRQCTSREFAEAREVRLPAGGSPDYRSNPAADTARQ